jgi:hypothetical protein
MPMAVRVGNAARSRLTATAAMARPPVRGDEGMASSTSASAAAVALAGSTVHAVG